MIQGRKQKEKQKPEIKTLETLDPKLRLIFSVPAWLKLQYLCHLGDTEIGGWGITREDDPLYVEEFEIIKQRCTAVTMKFDPIAISDHMARQFVRHKRQPNNCMRVWIHTHPGGMSAQPSGVDVDTFHTELKNDWMVMAILAKNGDTFARIAYNKGPAIECDIPVLVDNAAFLSGDYEANFQALLGQQEVWKADYEACVTKEHATHSFGNRQYGYPGEQQRGRYKVRENPVVESYRTDGSLDSPVHSNFDDFIATRRQADRFNDAISRREGPYAEWNKEFPIDTLSIVEDDLTSLEIADEQLEMALATMAETDVPIEVLNLEEDEDAGGQDTTTGPAADEGDSA